MRHEKPLILSPAPPFRNARALAAGCRRAAGQLGRQKVLRAQSAEQAGGMPSSVDAFRVRIMGRRWTGLAAAFGSAACVEQNGLRAGRERGILHR